MRFKLLTLGRALLGGLIAILLTCGLSPTWAQEGSWVVKKLDAQFASHPSINSSGEVVWSQQGGGICSSTRGTLAASGYFPHLANSGEVVYADMFEGPFWDLVSTTRGRLTRDGSIDINLSDFGLQSSGEVVYAARDSNNHAQVYSTVRGQITFGPTDHLNPCVNDNGEIAWNEFVEGVGYPVVSSTRGTLPMLPGMVGVGGCGLAGLNNNGDLCFIGNLETKPGWYTWPHVFSSAHGPIIADATQYQWSGSINDNGTVVFVVAGNLYQADWVGPPRLSIVPDASGFALEWPTNSGAFQVQYTTNFAQPFSWKVSTGDVSVKGSSFHQDVDLSLGPSALFRLSTGQP